MSPELESAPIATFGWGEDRIAFERVRLDNPRATHFLHRRSNQCSHPLWSGNEEHRYVCGEETRPGRSLCIRHDNKPPPLPTREERAALALARRQIACAQR